MRAGQNLHFRQHLAELLAVPAGTPSGLQEVSIALVHNGVCRKYVTLPPLTGVECRKHAPTVMNRFAATPTRIVAALPLAAYTTDANGFLTAFNVRAASFAGRVPVIGRDRWCVSWRLYSLDGTPMPHDQCPMAQALCGGDDRWGTEAVAERPDGARVRFRPHPVLLRDPNGHRSGGLNLLSTGSDFVDSSNATNGDAVDTHVGMRLMLRRAICGLCRPQLAAWLNRDVTEVEAMETGSQRISIWDLIEIAQALDVDLSWFFTQL
jgi:hypothetical protein